MSGFFRSGSAREFSPEGALPVIESVPRGGGVWCFTGSVAGGDPAVGIFFDSKGRAELCLFFPVLVDRGWVVG